MISSSNPFYNQFNQNQYDPGWQTPTEIGQYYGGVANKTQAELNNEINTRNTGYGIGANELQNQYGIATRDLANQEGEKGTWGSSARDIRMNSLANTYKNQFSNLYNTTQGQNMASLIGGEYNLGANNLPQADISKYAIDLNNNGSVGAYGAKASPSAGVKYNPFGFYGDIKRQYAQAAQYNKQNIGNMSANTRLMGQ